MTILVKLFKLDLFKCFIHFSLRVAGYVFTYLYMKKFRKIISVKGKYD